MNVSIGPTGSALAYLEGGLSGRRYQADEVATTDPEDGRPLLARYDFAGVREALDRSLSLPRRWGCGGGPRLRSRTASTASRWGGQDYALLLGLGLPPSQAGGLGDNK